MAGPGLRHDAVATKAVLHRDPCIEDNTPGVAFKNEQWGPYQDPTSATVSRVEVNETFTIEVGGKVEIRAAAFSGGTLPALGAKLYIITSSNLLTTVATGNVKFGVVDAVLTAAGRARVNTNLRDSF